VCVGRSTGSKDSTSTTSIASIADWFEATRLLGRSMKDVSLFRERLRPSVRRVSCFVPNCTLVRLGS
jgi:hypothetical protein